MKKTLTIILTTASMLLILDSVNFGQAVMMFLLAGVIPGTNIAINGTQMLEFISLSAGFIFARIALNAIRHFKSPVSSTSKARA